MPEIRLSAERSIDAPAEVVYSCIADYREFHRPGGFLPPAYSDFEIERGGVGAGTVIRFKITVGGQTRAYLQEVSEPEPGRVLVEAGSVATTTFTVLPEGQRSRVRFETVWNASGVQGFFERLLAPRMLRPLYLDELDRLERLARTLNGAKP